MKLRHTSFGATSARNAASASCSDIAGGSASGLFSRMFAGTVASIRAASEG